jgi:hypothetical protein
MTTAICADHGHELILIDDLLDPRRQRGHRAWPDQPGRSHTVYALSAASITNPSLDLAVSRKTLD